MVICPLYVTAGFYSVVGRPQLNQWTSGQYIAYNHDTLQKFGISTALIGVGANLQAPPGQLPNTLEILLIAR